MVDTVTNMLDTIATYAYTASTLTEEKYKKIESQSKNTSINIWQDSSCQEETLDSCSLNYFLTELTNPFNNSMLYIIFIFIYI